MTSDLERRMNLFSEKTRVSTQTVYIDAYGRLSAQVFSAIRPYALPAMAERVNTNRPTPADTKVLDMLDVDNLKVVGMTPAEFLAEVGKAIERASQLF